MGLVCSYLPLGFAIGPSVIFPSAPLHFRCSAYNLYNRKICSVLPTLSLPDAQKISFVAFPPSMDPLLEPNEKSTETVCSAQSSLQDSTDLSSPLRQIPDSEVFLGKTILLV